MWLCLLFKFYYNTIYNFLFYNNNNNCSVHSQFCKLYLGAEKKYNSNLFSLKNVIKINSLLYVVMSLCVCVWCVSSVYVEYFSHMHIFNCSNFYIYFCYLLLLVGCIFFLNNFLCFFLIPFMLYKFGYFSFHALLANFHLYFFSVFIYKCK